MITKCLILKDKAICKLKIKSKALRYVTKMALKMGEKQKLNYTKMCKQSKRL